MLQFLLLSVFTQIVFSANETERNVTITWQALKVAMPSNVVLPSELQYKHLKNANWSPIARTSPACISIPNDTEKTQRTIQRVVQDQVPFAVRSGGHMVAPGASNIDNGVLVDMSGFSETEYDPSAQVARVGSGARWKDVYLALEPHNTTAVGGRLMDIGVGGLLLGGGLSWLSNRYGLACDNVMNFEVILPNGTLVNANDSRSSDLFKALKGEGNNFEHMVWGGLRFYATDQFSTLVSALAKYQSSSIRDADADIMIQGPITNTSYGILLALTYSPPVTDPPAFDVFKDIPILLDLTSIRTFMDLVSSAHDTDVTQLPRWDFRTTTLALNSTFYNEVLNITTTSPEVVNISGLTSGTFVFNLQPISAGLVREGKSRGGDLLGLSEEPQIWLEYLTAWWDKEDDTQAYSPARSILNRVERATKESGDYLEYQFTNDASWDQDIMTHYGKESVNFLKQVQATYDPSKVFQRLVTGGYKIPS